MMEPILLPIADVAVNPLLIIAIGAIGGLLTGMISIGGGLFITPTLISIGIPAAIAVSSQINAMIGYILISFLTYQGRQDVDYKLGFLLSGWGIIGTLLGVGLLDEIDESNQLKSFIQWAYMAIIAVMSVVFLKQIIKNIKYLKSPVSAQAPEQPQWLAKLPWTISFKKTQLQISLIVLAIAGCINGLLISILGVGTGVFLIPALTYLTGRISPLIYGSCFITSIVICIISLWHQTLSLHSADLLLVLLLSIGGIIGSFVGVKCSYLIARPYVSLIGFMVMIFMLVRLGLQQFWDTISDPIQASHLEALPLLLFQDLPAYATVYPHLYISISVLLVMVLALLINKLITAVWQQYFKN